MLVQAKCICVVKEQCMYTAMYILRVLSISEVTEGVDNETPLISPELPNVSTQQFFAAEVYYWWVRTAYGISMLL